MIDLFKKFVIAPVFFVLGLIYILFVGAKMYLKRPILWGLGVASLVLIGYLFWTDPDRGGSTRDMLTNFATVGIAFTAASLIFKFTFDKISFGRHAEKAEEGSTASAIVIFACVIFILGAAFIFASRAHAQDVQTYVPAGANTYCPMLQGEARKLWPAHTSPAALCSLIEQETCVTLVHKMCWNPKARLKTDREEGAGLGQTTRAYNKDGTIRFDALQATKQLDASLADWNWGNVYQRPDLQLRSIVVINRDCNNRLSRLVSDPREVNRMCDAAYNGGYGGMQSERRACGLRPGCDPQKWVGHVENVCLKSKVKWQGYGKSACDINREHVMNVFDVRYKKYVKFTQVKI